MPHFGHCYLPCGTFNTLSLSKCDHNLGDSFQLFPTSPLTLKVTCLEHDKHRDPSRIGFDTMSKSGFVLNSSLQNRLVKRELLLTYIVYLDTIFSRCETSTCPLLLTATRHVGPSTHTLYLGVTTI